MAPQHQYRRTGTKGFTLVEVLVSVTILSIIILIIASAMKQTQEVWTSTQNRVEAYRESRASFEAMSRRLTEATLNSFWGYDDPTSPRIYVRHSDLHFVSGSTNGILGRGVYSGHAAFFQAPFGFAGSEVGASGMGEELDHLNSLLNGWGYYISYSSDLYERPDFLRTDTDTHPERMRYRLFEHRIPAEHLRLFDVDPASPLQQPKISGYTEKAQINSWISSAARGYRPGRAIADNILALVISPRAPTLASGRQTEYDIAPAYEYNTRLFQTESSPSTIGKRTRHQLPLVLELTLVATSESSWVRFEDREGTDGAASIATKVNSLFKNVSQYQEDIEELEDFLQEKKLDYRIFTDRIALRSAKWITEEE